MRLHTIAVAGALLLVGGATLAGADDVRIQFRLGTAEQPLTGQRYQTMRALAHYLDERADNALDDATRTGSWWSFGRRRSLASMKRFAARAHDFHGRMDNYITKPWDIPSEVQQLDSDARDVNRRMRNARVFQESWDSWNDVIDVIGRMNRLLAGDQVSVPPAHRPGWADYQRDYGSGRQGGYGGVIDESNGSQLVGGELREFKRLADRLEDQAIRAQQDAESAGDDTARNAMVSRDVRNFTQQARALQDVTQSASLDKQDVRPTVRHLLDDARRTDRNLRSTRDFSEVLPTWSQVIRTLEQMDDIVRS